MNKPYFSIVIACYNDGRYSKGNYLDRLLNSICNQGLDKDDIEVILSDDCSPEPFDDIVEPYLDKLIIKRTKTDYNFAPGNTRAKGLELVTGKWLCFADHDDMFYPNALGQVQAGIEDRKEELFAFTDFNGVDTEGNVTRKFECMLNWCHAKFYNYEKLWKPNDIHFIKDLKSHEDIAICTQVSCALHAMGRKELTYFSFPSYAWTDNPESLSHAKYTVKTDDGPREFLEAHFKDYVDATGSIYLDKFNNKSIDYVYTATHLSEIVLYCYFYTQGFQFRRPNDYLKENLVIAGELVRDIKQYLNISTEQLYQIAALDNAARYYEIRKLADPGSGRYIPVQTFPQWLELVSNMYSVSDNGTVNR